MALGPVSVRLLQGTAPRKALLDEFHLHHVRKNNGDSLSGGERRRTEIARALAVDPKFILLDEPFAGVDPIAVDDIQTVVARLKFRNIGILITDHNVNETLSICDRAYLLIDGKIFKHGTAEELAEDEQVRRLYLGRNFELKRKDYLHDEARKEQEKKNSPAATNRLVMGPWIHGGWARGEGDKLGDVPFNAKTSEYFQQHIQFPFFEYYLKGKGKPDNTEAWIFETGSNVWRQYQAWPPKGLKPKSLYFHGGGKLTESSPGASKEKAGKLKADKDRHDKDRAGKQFDEYVSDPAHPVPFLERTATSIARDYMDADQRFATRRSDVVAY